MAIVAVLATLIVGGSDSGRGTPPSPAVIPTSSPGVGPSAEQTASPVAQTPVEATPVPAQTAVPAQPPALVQVTNPIAPPASDSLVHRWSAENNANDSVGDNDGDADDDVRYLDGKFGKAFSFDGSSSVKLGDIGPLPTEGTIDLWINPSVVDNPRIPFSTNHPAGDDNLRFEINGSGDLYAVVGDRAGGYIEHPELLFTGSLQPGEWHHVALLWTRGGRDLLGYLDGELAFVNGNPFLPPGYGNAAIGVGFSTSPSRFWKGLIDEVSIYNRALSANEIKAIFEADGMPIFTGEKPTGAATVEAPTNYPDFASLAGLNLVGEATRTSNDILSLTPLNTPLGVGGAWLSSKQSVADGFETTFQFQFTAPFSGDGLAFVVQNDNALALGRQGDPYAGIRNSVAVEFDNFQHNQNSDPNSNHVSVHTLGTQPNSGHHSASIGIATPQIDMSDGRPHTVKISYVPGTMTIYLDDLNNPLLEVSLDIATRLTLSDGEAWVGIVAQKGGANLSMFFDVLNWSFAPVSTPDTTPVPIPAPEGLVVWLPGDGTALELMEGVSTVHGGGVSYAPGIIGEALSFDGSGGSIHIPSPQDPDITGITVDAWINIGNASNLVYDFASQWNGPSVSWEFGVRAGK